METAQKYDSFSTIGVGGCGAWGAINPQYI